MQTHLMATRAGRPEHTAEAEPVLVHADGRTVVLTLDDGERLEFDQCELVAALVLGRALPRREAA